MKEARTMEHLPTGLLLVSQPDTPGQSRIPATSRETRVVENIISPTGIKSLLLEADAATIVRVQEEMRRMAGFISPAMRFRISRSL